MTIKPCTNILLVSPFPCRSLCKVRNFRESEFSLTNKCSKRKLCWCREEEERNSWADVVPIRVLSAREDIWVSSRGPWEDFPLILQHNTTAEDDQLRPCVAKNCDWRPVIIFFAKKKETELSWRMHFFFNSSHCLSDRDSATADFSGRSCALCTHFSCSVAHLVQGRNTNNWKHEKRRRLSWTVNSVFSPSFSKAYCNLYKILVKIISGIFGGQWFYWN